MMMHVGLCKHAKDFQGNVSIQVTFDNRFSHNAVMWGMKQQRKRVDEYK